LACRTRLSGPDGNILIDSTSMPATASCRALLARGITGSFETRKLGIEHACLSSDIEKVAGMTVQEADNR
jgi:hypothetical protein